MIDKNIIGKVAAVAHLTLSEKEEEKYLQEFKDILTAFNVLDEVDTFSIKSSFHPIESEQIRDDVPKSSSDRKRILSLDKNSEDGYFIGPRTV